MHKRISFAAPFLAAAMTLSAPASAQSVDLPAISAACATSADACQAAVRIAIAAVRAAGLSPAAANAQLGVIAGVAVQAAATLPTAQRVAVGSVLTEIAAASTNPVQQQTLAQLANQLQSGASVAELTATASSLSAS